VSANSIRRLRTKARLEPAPRRSGPSWHEFLHAQAVSIVACDFFTVECLFLRRYYALFFIAHGNRRVWLAGCTANPTGAWVTQQARNLGLDFSDQGVRFLIRDRDSKYSGPLRRRVPQRAIRLQIAVDNLSANAPYHPFDPRSRGRRRATRWTSGTFEWPPYRSWLADGVVTVALGGREASARREGWDNAALGSHDDTLTARQACG
jgi:hypothetical protein